MGYALFNYSIWKSSSSDRICRIYGSRADSLFVMKSMMKDKPIRFISIVFISAILIFTEALHICEAPLIRIRDKESVNGFQDALWMVVVTSMTIGYGDLVPQTPPGRVLMFFCSMFGVIMVGLLVVTVENSLQMNNVQSNAFLAIKKMKLKSEMKTQAAKVIGLASRLYLSYTKEVPIEPSQVFNFEESMRNLRKATNLYKNTHIRSAEFADIFVEFENAKISRQEIGLFISVLARMVDHLDYKEDQSQSVVPASDIRKDRQVMERVVIES